MYKEILQEVLRASKNLANETLLRDLKLISIDGLMAIRLLKFRSKMAQEVNSLNTDIFKLNKDIGLGWEKRCQEIITRYEINEQSSKFSWVCKIEQFEDLAQQEALRNKITTGVYRTLISCTEKERIPEYLLQNSSMFLSTGLIFQLRSGSNFRNDCLHTRHLKDEPKCLGCGAWKEDVEHIIEL